MEGSTLRRIAAIGFVPLLSLPASFACAASWPDRTITFVAPFAAGGQVDLVARIVAKTVGEALHQAIVVENLPGAGGALGAAHVARGPKDGYTFLIGSAGTIINSLIRTDQPFKDSELTPVVKLSDVPSVLVTNPSNPAHSLKEFVAQAKANHVDRITFSSAGAGSTPELVGEMLREATGLPIQMISYKSGLESVMSVVTKQTDIASEAAVVTLPLIKGGKLRALAETLDKRMAAAPDIPTTAEEGFPSIRIGHWAGLFAPTGSPAEALNKMNEAVTMAMKNPELMRTFAASSIQTGGGSRESFAKFTVSERERMGKLVKAGHMQAD